MEEEKKESINGFFWSYIIYKKNPKAKAYFCLFYTFHKTSAHQEQNSCDQQHKCREAKYCVFQFKIFSLLHILESKKWKK